MGLLVPLIIGNAVDDLTTGITWGKLSSYALLILISSIASGIFLFFQRRLIISISRDIEYDMRRDFYHHLQDQPLDFFQSNRTGELMARATNDLSAVRQLIGPAILYILQTFFVVIFVLPLMLRISVKLTLLLFISMPLVTVSVRYLGRQVHVRFEQIQHFFAQISARAQENLSGVRVVRAYAQETAELEAFNKLNRQYAERNLSLVRISALLRPLIQVLIGFGSVLILWYGGTLAERGEITIGQYTEFNLYIVRLVWPLIAIGFVVNLYERGTASFNRMQKILQIEPSIKDAPGVQRQPPITGRIELRDLTFSYTEIGPPVLSNVNLRIEAGQTVAIVGATGSGKSTLIQLIPRLLDCAPGTLLIDGRPIRDYPIKQLRESIGYVQQETFLFSDTLAENIAFGVNTTDEEEVAQAAEIAGLTAEIHDFPDGFKTLVGERGITLSGGQKQRTAIARAVMRKPSILILDDALSSVDTQTEEKILQNLRQVMQSCTSIIVSHRISTVQDADLICVIHRGRIVERGKHNELLARGGKYADLYERQLLEEELAAS